MMIFLGSVLAGIVVGIFIMGFFFDLYDDDGVEIDAPPRHGA